MYFWNRRLEGGLKQAMEHFQQAVEADPCYALAHAGIADTFNSLGYFGYLRPEEAFPSAKAAARKALEIDEALGEAHASLGFAATHYDWDWQTAEREFQRSIELNPSYPSVHQWYGLLLVATGRLDEALAEGTFAQELDPLSLINNAALGVIYYLADQYDECIQRQQQILEMEPNFLLSYVYLTLAHVGQESYEEAVAAAGKAEALVGDNSYVLALLGLAYGVSGRRDDAHRILDMLRVLSKKRYVAPSHKAVVLLSLGLSDDAIKQLEEACVAHDPLLIGVKSAPGMDCLHADKRLRELYERSGLL